MKKLIDINNIYFSVKDKVILNNISNIQVFEGDRIGILGENGSGKTSMIKVLLKLIPVKSSIDYNISLFDISTHMQSNNFSDLLYVKEIIKIILNLNKIDEVLLKTLELYDLHGKLNTKYSKLSGGEKQKLSLFLVMSFDKELYIFDELSTGLDYNSRSEIMKIFDECTKDKTVLVVSHYFEELDNQVNKLVILNNGNLLEYGYIDELYNKYELYCAYLVEEPEEDLLNNTDFDYVESNSGLIVFFKNESEEQSFFDNVISKYKYNYKKLSKTQALYEIIVKEKLNNAII